MTYNYLFNNPPKLYVALRDLYQLSFYFKNCTCKGVVLDGFGIATVEVEISSTVPCDIENSLIRIIFRSDCANECTILIDGHTNIQCFWKIMFPLAQPAIVTVSIFNFIGKWNEYFMALIFANKSNLRPIGVGLYQTVTSMMNSGDWAGMFASVVIVFVPTVVIYAFLSDKIISGVTAGGNKG